MSYLKLAHQLVDGVHNGDLKAVAAVLGILAMTALSGYVTTKLTQWGTKKGWQAVKWLVTPKPMEGLAKTLYEALERGAKREHSGDLIVENRIVFTGVNGYRPRSIWVYDNPLIGASAPSIFGYTDLTPLLTRRDRRYLCWLAGWHRDCLRQDRDLTNKKQAWVKGMEVAEAIATFPTVRIAQEANEEVGIPSAWGAPQPCRCNPNTDDTCNTCTGGEPSKAMMTARDTEEAHKRNGQIANGHVVSDGQPLEGQCQCASCKQERKTKWKRDA